jgi:hypothetical protein
MLWHKGWLETRFRMLFAAGFMGVILTLQYSQRASPQGVRGIVQFSIPSFVAGVCAMLAGAGITTQPTLRVSKGIHGSTLFTLSLPVSRFRLLAVRASIGWLEAIVVIGAFCFESWLLSPALRGMATGADMFRHAGALAGCASAIYCLSVLLGTLVDDQVRVWCTLMATGVLWWLSGRGTLPAFADIIRGMSKGSPLIAHTMPWSTMGFSVGVAAVLLFVALKVVQAREY